MRNRNFIAFVILTLVSFFVYQSLSLQNPTNQVAFSEFLDLVRSRQVIVAVIKDSNLEFQTSSQQFFSTTIPDFFPELSQILYENGTEFRVKSATTNSLLFNIFVQWLPMIVLVSIWIIFMRQMQGGRQIMGFGRVNKKDKQNNAERITFDDVAGIDEAKNELEEVVDFLKNPKKFQDLGGKVPHGVLLCGQPGTGKTLLARAVAGEAKAAFFSVSGSEFVEMFVGIGAARVRDVFQQARLNTPCIIFIDEIDAVGRHRGSGLGGGNDEREQTLNQILVEMDGFKTNSGIIVVAATNRPDTLDPALTRPGRFDRTVIVPLPDKNGRKKILDIHCKKIKIDPDTDLDAIAASTQGFSGADLQNLVNEAALLAGRLSKQQVGYEDFESARDKIIMGNERRSMSMTEKEIETTAYHEAGHALVAAMSDETDILHKVTIIPRGRALGVTMFLPDDRQKLYTKNKINNLLKMIMGGRAAEEIIYNHFTTGAHNDLEKATEYAHRMVCNWGMSEKIGPFYLSSSNENVFLGRDMIKRKKTSQETAAKIDSEVKKIVHKAYQSALDVLKKNVSILHNIANKLIKEETIEGAEIKKIVEASLKKI